MDATKAREILSFSKSKEGYEAEIPADDDAAVADAVQLIQQAAIAWNKNNARGPEVSGVLRLADETFDGTGDFMLANGQPATATPQPPEPAEATETPAEVPTAPQAAPQAPQTLDPELLTRQEPWVDYDKDDVPTIVAGLDAALHEKDASEIFMHVWAYESAHKKRERILDHLRAIADGMQPPPPHEPRQDQADEPAQPAPQTPDSESPPPEKSIDYRDLITEIEEDLKRERLALPEPPAEAAPAYPYSIREVSDADLRELHNAFSAYGYWADSKVARHDAIATRMRQMADEIVRELLLKVAQYDEKGRERRMTFITAEVESTPAVVELRKIQRQHEIFAEVARRERDGFYKNVEALSRQETMRHDEWLRSQK